MSAIAWLRYLRLTSALPLIRTLARHSFTTTTTGLHETNGKPPRESPLLVITQRTQVVLIDCGTDGTTQLCSCHLVGPKMYSAVDARVGDVVGNLLKRGILQHDAGHGRICQCDRMSSFAVKTSHDLGRRVTCTAVG